MAQALTNWEEACAQELNTYTTWYQELHSFSNLQGKINQIPLSQLIRIIWHIISAKKF